MKITKVLLIVAVLVMALATSAMASETKWSFAMDITSSNYNNYQLGTDEAGQVNGTNQSSSYITNTAGYCLGYSGATRFDTNSELLAITAGESGTWSAYAWVGNGFVGNTATISWKSPTGLPATISNMPYTLKVKILSDPTNTYAAGTEWIIPSNLGATYVIGATFGNANDATKLDAIRYTQQANVVPGKSSAFDLSTLNNGKAVKMEVTMAPTPSVPEPGSMLALATGLVGLAGGLLRKRS
ncbi:MAG: PEP-CTERM sorting domain-containing protein [Armatimonadota bacterium]